MTPSRAGLRVLRQAGRLTQDDIVQSMRQQGSSITQTELSLVESGLKEASSQMTDQIRRTIELILAERLATVRRLLGSDVRSRLRHHRQAQI